MGRLYFRNRFRRFRRSTDTIEYVVRYDETEDVRVCESKTCRLTTFMNVRVGGRWRRALKIPCLATTRNSGGDEEHYYRERRTQFTKKLRSFYRGISRADADKVTGDFMAILRIANAIHVCPDSNPDIKCDTIHDFSVESGPHGALEPDPDTDLITDWSDWVRGPSAVPATTASIVELLKAREGDVTGDCAVCLEGMGARQRTPIKMPCSHSFHAACIIKWLEKSQFCPLCRYQMPAPKFSVSPTHI